MGLYDNYRAINSQTVSSFVPDKSKEIREFIDRGNQRYEATQNYIASTTEALKTVPVREEDQQLYQQINQEARQKIDEFSSRPDLENITGDVYKYATHVAGKLKDLAGAKKVEQDYMSALQNKDYGLDADTQKKLYAMSKDKSTPIQYDPSGRVTGGFNGVTPAKAVDKAKKIREYLSIMPDNTQKISVKGISADGQVEYMDASGNTTKLPENIRTTLMAAISSDPELQAWDNQEAMLNAHFSTKGVSDEAVLSMLQSAPKNNADAIWHSELKNMISKGIPPSEALKSVEQDRQLNAVRSRELQYALGATKNDYNSESSQDWSWQRKEDYEQVGRMKVAEIKDESDIPITGPGASLPVEIFGTTGKEVAENSTKYSDNLRVTNEQLSKLDKDLSLPVDASTKAGLMARKKDLLATQAYQQDLVDQTNKANSNLRNSVAIEKFGTTYDQLKTDVVTKLKELGINKPISMGGITVSPEEIAEAIGKGDFSIRGNEKFSNKAKFSQEEMYKLTPEQQMAPATIIIKGKTIPLVGSTGSIFKKALETNKTMFETIESEKSNRAVSQTDIQNSGVTVPNDVLSSIKKKAGDMPIRDAQFNKVTPEDLTDIDWEKSLKSLGSLNEQSQTLPFKAYTTDGEYKGTYLLDGTGSNIKFQIGKKFMTNPDPSIQQLGKRILSNNDASYQQAFSVPTSRTTHPLNPSEPMKLGPNPVMAVRNPNGTYSITDLKGNSIKVGTGKSTLDGLSFSTFTDYMNLILEEQAKQ